MSNQKLHLSSLGLLFLFLIIGWVVAKPLINSLGNYYSSRWEIQFLTFSMSSQFKLHLFLALSIACIPIINWATLFLIKISRNKGITIKFYFSILSILTGSFIIGACIKIALFSLSLNYLDKHPISPSIKETMDIEAISFNGLAILAAVFSGFLIYIATPNKENGKIKEDDGD